MSTFWLKQTQSIQNSWQKKLNWIMKGMQMEPFFCTITGTSAFCTFCLCGRTRCSETGKEGEQHISSPMTVGPFQNTGSEKIQILQTLGLLESWWKTQIFSSIVFSLRRSSPLGHNPKVLFNKLKMFIVWRRAWRKLILKCRCENLTGPVPPYFL